MTNTIDDLLDNFADAVQEGPDLRECDERAAIVAEFERLKKIESAFNTPVQLS